MFIKPYEHRKERKKKVLCTNHSMSLEKFKSLRRNRRKKKVLYGVYYTSVCHNILVQINETMLNRINNKNFHIFFCPFWGKQNHTIAKKYQ